MTSALDELGRGPFDGVRMILRYNWPLYLAGVATAVAGGVLSRRGRTRLVRTGGTLAAAGASWLAVGSVAASWWVYDRSDLYRWGWLDRAVPRDPTRLLVLHAGLDEASGPLRRLRPDATIVSEDLHRGLGRTTASLRLARRTATAGSEEVDRDEDAFDAAVLFLSAHELRDQGARRTLFDHLHRRLRPGGRLVLVEHVRDVVNAFAFGPAVGHFYPAGLWRDLVTASGFEMVADERITPFVLFLTAKR